jgi:hypothetical protein
MLQARRLTRLTPPALTHAPPLPQIWFLGKADVQKIEGNPHLQKTNYGYDDERGDYVVSRPRGLAGPWRGASLPSSDSGSHPRAQSSRALV